MVQRQQFRSQCEAISDDTGLPHLSEDIRTEKWVTVTHISNGMDLQDLILPMKI